MVCWAVLSTTPRGVRNLLYNKFLAVAVRYTDAVLLSYCFSVCLVQTLSHPMAQQFRCWNVSTASGYHCIES